MIARLRALWCHLRLWLRLRWIARLNRDAEWSPQTGYLPVDLGRGIEATHDGRLYGRGKGGEVRRLDGKRDLTKRQRKALADLIEIAVERHAKMKARMGL